MMPAARPTLVERPRAAATVTQRSLIKAWIACLLLISLVGFEPVAHAAKAQVNSKVPAGKWKAVRLKNLPQGTSLSVRVAASGSLVVILVHEAELKRYPSPISPAFQGTLERTLSFSVVIPESGNYYVIFDNRRGSDERRVLVQIQAIGPKSRDEPTEDSGVRKEKI